MTATYATVSSVQARLRGRSVQVPFSASTKPTQTDVQGWLDEAQDELDATLIAVGLPAPYTTQRAVSILGQRITDYAEGHVRQVNASTGGDGTNQDGQKLLDDWKKFLEELRTDTEFWSLKLGGEGESSTSAGVVMSVGGISNAENAALDADTDWRGPAFRRGQDDYL